MGKRLILQDVLFALRETHGILTETCQRLDCSRKGLYLFIARHATAQDALQEAREMIVDRAERSLLECLDAKESWAIALVLRTLGKRRGWGETFVRGYPWSLVDDLNNQEMPAYQPLPVFKDDDGLLEAFEADDAPIPARATVEVSTPSPVPVVTPAVVAPPAPEPRPLLMRREDPDAVKLAQLEQAVQGLIHDLRRKI